MSAVDAAIQAIINCTVRVVGGWVVLLALAVCIDKISLSAYDTVRRRVEGHIDLDFTIGNVVGLRDAYRVGQIKLEAIHALNTVSFVDYVGPGKVIDNTHGAIGDLPLTTGKVVSGRCAGLLVVSNSQIKSTNALVANIVLETQVAV